MASHRPAAVAGSIDRPRDDGLFGPESVSWRVFAAPAASIGVATAVLMQMLHPKVVRMIDQASTFRQDPEGRARLTGEYAITITYGDVAAERAGEVLRTIHSHKQAVDPVTGETYTPNEPDLLLWVHGSLTWAVLNACLRWGPAFTNPERDRFVDEQRTAARLVGIDPELAPRSEAELNDYLLRMLPHLAYVTDTKFLREMMVPPKLPFTPSGLVSLVITRAAADLLPAPMQDLYGFRWTGLNHALVSLGARAIVATADSKMPYEKLLPELRAQATAHAFGGAAKQRRTTRKAT